ncbi:MAG: hypothetical protein J6B53_07490 [Clostridia bacterium]|nr:hypothetical protein [Clostridia bacterium]
MQNNPKASLAAVLRWAAVAVLLILLALLVPSPAMMESAHFAGEAAVELAGCAREWPDFGPYRGLMR